MPVRIDESTFYTMGDLGVMFEGAVGIDTLLSRLGLRDARVFKAGVWGFELMLAARKAPSFSEASNAGATVVDVMRAGRKGRAKGGPLKRITPDDLRD